MTIVKKNTHRKTSVSKNVENPGKVYRNAKWYRQYSKQHRGSLQNKSRTTMESSNPLLGIYSIHQKPGSQTDI